MWGFSDGLCDLVFAKIDYRNKKVANQGFACMEPTGHYSFIDGY